jgi:CRISPR/Cas system-associated endoribonuclease Cas2
VVRSKIDAARAGYLRSLAAARLTAAVELQRAYDQAVQHSRYVGLLTPAHRDHIRDAEARWDAVRRGWT